MRSLDELLALLGERPGARVLVRSDLNVPLDGATITDDGRIRASVPTLQGLVDAGAKVVVVAHLGRPKGEVRPELSLAPVAARLAELVTAPVSFAPVSSGPEAVVAVDGMAPGGVLVLQNVRFDPRETSKVDVEREALADEYAQLCDFFVSDGFGVVHRKQASVYDVARRRPCYAGRLVAAEMQVLSRLTDEPQRPYAVVLGGSKISDKLGVIAHLL
ncbi:MAG TPA: phosphoglycerate kinase, partial [Actinomycetes bacterium]|nr:phosphoglycerate kinase [Actinomycetes bacterium]